MRICPQCKSEMTDGYTIKVEGGMYSIQIVKGDKLFRGRIDSPKVALCQNCGEISMYLDDLTKL